MLEVCIAGFQSEGRHAQTQYRGHFHAPGSYAGVAKLEDAHDLGSCLDRNCGFESRHPHYIYWPVYPSLSRKQPKIQLFT